MNVTEKTSLSSGLTSVSEKWRTVTESVAGYVQIPSASEDWIRLMWGTNDLLMSSVDQATGKIPSYAESIRSAGRFVMKQAQKGCINNPAILQVQHPEDLMIDDRRIKRRRWTDEEPKKHEPIQARPPEVNIPEDQRRWLGLQCVKRLFSDLDKINFRRESDRLIQTDRARDAVFSLIARIQHDYRRAPKSHAIAQRAMNEFVKRAHEIRAEILKDCLELAYDDCRPAGLVREFTGAVLPSAGGAASRRDVVPIDPAFDKALHASMPDGYRPGTRTALPTFDPGPRVDLSIVIDTPRRKGATLLLTPTARGRSGSMSHSTSRETLPSPEEETEINEAAACRFWESCDPLGRSGAEPLEAAISEVKRPVTVDSGIFEDLECRDWAATGERVRAHEAVRKISSYGSRQAVPNPFPEIVEAPGSPVKVEVAAPTRMDRQSAWAMAKADLAFLDAQTVRMQEDHSDNPLHDRMKAIWDRLEFTTMQRLAMSARYSERVERVDKIDRILELWSKAVDSYDATRRAVTEVKDVLARTHNPKPHMLEPSIIGLRQAHRALRRDALMLQAFAGDEFKVKGRTCGDICEHQLDVLRIMFDRNDISYPLVTAQEDWRLDMTSVG